MKCPRVAHEIEPLDSSQIESVWSVSEAMVLNKMPLIREESEMESAQMLKLYATRD